MASEHSAPQVLLVTGALGCIGAWVTKRALDQGLVVVAMDTSTSGHRLDLAFGDDTDTTRLIQVTADIRDSEAVIEILRAHGVTAIVHLASLQVPAVAAQPLLGAEINVIGMAVILDSMVKCDIASPLAYASSIAAYDDTDNDPSAPPELTGAPSTLYGVYKRANEGAAYVYSRQHGLSSIGLRPYVVYGPGRDQGMTSDPTSAMRSVVEGQPFHIRFGGVCQMQYVEDVAEAFLAAALSDYQGATVADIGGPGLRMDDIIEAMAEVDSSTKDLVTFDDVQLPFPTEVRSDLEAFLPTATQTPLADGVARTMERFRWASHNGI